MYEVNTGYIDKKELQCQPSRSSITIAVLETIVVQSPFFNVLVVKVNLTGATSGTGTAYHFGKSDITTTF